MANLANREHLFQDLFDFRRDFDQMFNRMLTGRRGQQDVERRQRGDISMPVFTPAIEAYVNQENKKFVCRVALAGVNPKDVNIEVQGNVLTITGERQFSDEQREGALIHSEFAYGAFERDIELPEGVDAQKINAEYRNGLLEISAPISAAALPRRVEIRNAEGQQEVKRMSASASGSSSSSSSSR
jgi:HSP20 family protein